MNYFVKRTNKQKTMTQGQNVLIHFLLLVFAVYNEILSDVFVAISVGFTGVFNPVMFNH